MFWIPREFTGLQTSQGNTLWNYFNFRSLQLLSNVQLFETPCTAACQASLSIINSWSLSKFMSIESVMPSSHHILCCPLSPPASNPSQHQGLFQWVSSLHQMFIFLCIIYILRNKNSKQIVFSFLFSTGIIQS